MLRDSTRRRSKGVDLNILPEKMRRPTVELTAPSTSGLTILFWVAAIVATLLLAALLQFQARAQQDLTERLAAQRLLEAEIQRRKALPGEIEKLRTTLTQTLQLSAALEEDYRSLVMGEIYWAEILETIRGAVPPGVDLISISQKASQVIVSGSGDNQAVVTLFAGNLKKTGRFANVAVQSLTEEPPPVPTATPTALGTAVVTSTVVTGTATATATPVVTSTTVTAPVTPIPTPTVPFVRAEIVSVAMQPFRVASGEVLRIDVGVRNTGNVPLRSQDPVSGYTYREGETVPVPGMIGRFRVGVDFSGRDPNNQTDHPYRWGWSGELLSGETVDLTCFIELHNPGVTEYWVGLVRENVGWVQDGYSRSYITVLAPTATPTTAPTATPTPLPTVTPTPTATPTATPLPIASAEVITVTMRPTTLVTGSVLQVDALVRNKGTLALRSQAPFSGYAYDEGAIFPGGSVTGRYRVGVDYSGRVGSVDHPYRWGWNGDLAPGATVTVTGYIRLTSAATREYWLGLIQEGDGWLQDNVGRTIIRVLPPGATPTPTRTRTPTRVSGALIAPAEAGLQGPSAAIDQPGLAVAVAEDGTPRATSRPSWGLPSWLLAAGRWLLGVPAVAEAAPLNGPGAQRPVSFTIILELKRGAP